MSGEEKIAQAVEHVRATARALRDAQTAMEDASHARAAAHDVVNQRKDERNDAEHALREARYELQDLIEGPVWA